VKSLLQAAIIFIMISTMVGCSVFRSHTQMMNVTCSQAEAKLYINGREDKNPFEGRVPRNRGVIIECEKEGYDGATRFVNYRLNTTGYLDIVGGFLIYIPYVGLFFPGAYSLQDTDIQVQMVPLPATVSPPQSNK
jgi:hypothetical protein